MDVYYDGSFWDHNPDGTPCRPVQVNREFGWNGYTWMIPAIYVCSQGFAVDLCKQVPLAEVKAFVEKWKSCSKKRRDKEDWNEEDYKFAEYENPLSNRFRLDIRTDGAQIRPTRSCGTCWQPFEDDGRGASREAQDLMAAYNCSRDYGWAFSRHFFQWDFDKVPENVRLSLTFKPEKYMLPCPEHFTVLAEMEEKRVKFTHPVTGSAYILTVREATREMLPESEFEDNGEFTYPRHFLRLCYRLASEQEYEQFFPRDCSQGDSPRRNRAPEGERTLLGAGRSVAAVGMIMGSDSCSGTQNGTPIDHTGRNACSSLHFAPVDQTEWRIEACVLTGKECELSLDMDIA